MPKQKPKGAGIYPSHRKGTFLIVLIVFISSIVMPFSGESLAVVCSGERSVYARWPITHNKP